MRNNKSGRLGGDNLQVKFICWTCACTQMSHHQCPCSGILGRQLRHNDPSGYAKVLPGYLGTPSSKSMSHLRLFLQFTTSAAPYPPTLTSSLTAIMSCITRSFRLNKAPLGPFSPSAQATQTRDIEVRKTSKEARMQLAACRY